MANQEAALRRLVGKKGSSASRAPQFPHCAARRCFQEQLDVVAYCNYES